jgi:hypothetical protein
MAEEKYQFITRRLQETLGGDIIKAILAEGRAPKGYWGAYLIISRDHPQDLSLFI